MKTVLKIVAVLALLSIGDILYMASTVYDIV